MNKRSTRRVLLLFIAVALFKCMERGLRFFQIILVLSEIDALESLFEKYNCGGDFNKSHRAGKHFDGITFMCYNC